MKPGARPRAPLRASRTPAVLLLIEEPAWRKDKAVLNLIRRAARTAGRIAARSSPRPKGGKGTSLTILLADNARLRALNAHFRGKDKPTNVLSFPAPGDGAYLGDIAIAHGVTARQARAQGKSLAAHAAHLAAHGVLHLLGYDHEKASEAKTMEALETAILARLGIADPYLLRPYTGRRKTS